MEEEMDERKDKKKLIIFEVKQNNPRQYTITEQSSLRTTNSLTYKFNRLYSGGGSFRWCCVTKQKYANLVIKKNNTCREVNNYPLSYTYSLLILTSSITIKFHSFLSEDDN